MSDKEVSLDELMVAMDAVDTLRHQEKMIDRELSGEERREKLRTKLKEIYAQQGINVTDEILEEGIRAMEEERFVFDPPLPGWKTRLATLYVKRDRWLKPAGYLFAAMIVAGSTYYLLHVRPQMIAKASLPKKVEKVYDAITRLGSDPKVLSLASALKTQAHKALKKGDLDMAKKKLEKLRDLQDRLDTHYEVDIVQEPGKRSGIWRRPPGNPYAKNYYLIVEAVNSEGEKIPVLVHNEENDKNQKVRRWGIRVDKNIYERVARDKADDGIIQHRKVGSKARGKLTPTYTIPTRGAAITQW